MILHAAELWAVLAACFLAGCLVGTFLMRLVRWAARLAVAWLAKAFGLPVRSERPQSPVPLPAVVPVEPPAPRRLAGPMPGSIAGAGIAPSRPLPLPGPRGGRADPLQTIDGLEKRHMMRLAAIGIYHFSQIAAWTPQEIAYVARHLGIGDRIVEKDWVGQAARLASEVVPAPSRGWGKAKRKARPDPSGEAADEVDDR